MHNKNISSTKTKKKSDFDTSGALEVLRTTKTAREENEENEEKKKRPTRAFVHLLAKVFNLLEASGLYNVYEQHKVRKNPTSDREIWFQVRNDELYYCLLPDPERTSKGLTPPFDQRVPLKWDPFSESIQEEGKGTFSADKGDFSKRDPTEVVVRLVCSHIR